MIEKSLYTLEVKLPKSGDLALYNTRNGALAVLSAEEAVSFEEDSARKFFEPGTLTDDLVDIGMLVMDATFEREQLRFRFTETVFQNNTLWLGMVDASSNGARVFDKPLRLSIASFVSEQITMQKLREVRAFWAQNDSRDFLESMALLDKSLRQACRGLQVGYRSPLDAEKDSFETASEAERDNQNQEDRSLLPKPYHCLAPVNRAYFIDCEGFAYKCELCAGNPAFSAFNVLDALENRHVSWDNITHYVNFNPSDDDQCRSCCILPICQGGCTRRFLDGRRECSPLKNSIEEAIVKHCASLGIE